MTTEPTPKRRGRPPKARPLEPPNPDCSNPACIVTCHPDCPNLHEVKAWLDEERELRRQEIGDDPTIRLG